MRIVQRSELDADSFASLRTLQARVDAHETPSREASRLWSGRPAIVGAVRDELRRMASGRSRCMYCEDGEGTDVDHFWPKDSFPERVFVWLNHVLACARCNRRKATTFPLGGDGSPILIDPTVEEPTLHLTYSPMTGRFEPRDERGVRSIEVYDLNRELLVDGRRDTWIYLDRLCASYARHRDRGQDADADAVIGAIARFSFAAVHAAFVRIGRSPLAARYLTEEAADALRRYPELTQPI